MKRFIIQLLVWLIIIAGLVMLSVWFDVACTPLNKGYTSYIYEIPVTYTHWWLTFFASWGILALMIILYYSGIFRIIEK